MSEQYIGIIGQLEQNNQLKIATIQEIYSKMYMTGGESYYV